MSEDPKLDVTRELVDELLVSVNENWLESNSSVEYICYRLGAVVGGIVTALDLLVAREEKRS